MTVVVRMKMTIQNSLSISASYEALTGRNCARKVLSFGHREAP
jgi:hypothetical protein